MEHEVSDRNEWFKDVKRLIRGLEVETVEDPFACPTVKSVTDGDDVRRHVHRGHRHARRPRHLPLRRRAVLGHVPVRGARPRARVGRPHARRRHRAQMYSWMWDEESVMCEQLGLAEVKAEKGGDE